MQVDINLAITIGALILSGVANSLVSWGLIKTNLAVLQTQVQEQDRRAEAHSKETDRRLEAHFKEVDRRFFVVESNQIRLTEALAENTSKMSENSIILHEVRVLMKTNQN